MTASLHGFRCETCFDSAEMWRHKDLLSPSIKLHTSIKMSFSTPKVKLFAALVAPFLFASQGQAFLVIAGVTDGDLSGGNPKSIILQAAAPIADLSMWGVGSANNGGGSDGEEFTFPAISLSAGDTIVVAGNSVSADFFTNNFVQNFILYTDGGANINGDDAIELFMGGAVFDTYGDIATDGTGQSWDHIDGFATRIGGGPGAFDQANYSSNPLAFDGLDESQHVAIFVGAGFTPIPEPGITSLLALGLVGALRRRRR